jgi:hypothetical protein
LAVCTREGFTGLFIAAGLKTLGQDGVCGGKAVADGSVNVLERNDRRIVNLHRGQGIHPQPPTVPAEMKGIPSRALNDRYVDLGEVDGKRS